MPVVTVYGIPEETIGLIDLMKEIQVTVSSISELQLTSDQITVFFPKDLVTEGLGDEIIVDVQKLTDKLERTEKVLNNLAEKLANMVINKVRIPNLIFVEVFVQCFGSNKTGFCRVDK